MFKKLHPYTRIQIELSLFVIGVIVALDFTGIINLV